MSRNAAMQTWKVSRTSKKRTSTSSPWGRRILAIVLLVATLGVAIYDFPVVWNRTAEAIASSTSISLPRLSEDSFRLGLDLQGGTHLVYEADMSAIPQSERLEALEGVRDVIERRVNAFGVSEPVVQTVTTGGTHRIIIELAGVTDVNEAINQIGETPVLEFKEPGQELQREPTEEEQARLKELQTEQRQTAQAVLEQAVGDYNFNELVTEHSIDPAAAETQGILRGITKGSAVYGPIAEAIERHNLQPGQVVPELIETEEGLNIVKYTEQGEASEMLLSHILICFEGKIGCENPVPAIDASLRIQELKEQATPENFADLAKEHSTEPGATESGGDLGWIAPGQTVPAFELTAAAIAPGEISDVVETEFGYHLIHKRDQRPVAAYNIQRVLMRLATIYDVVPEVSPWKNTALSGKQLERAGVEFNPQTGAPIVSLQFNGEGGDLFGELTSRNVGNVIAIFLDGQPISTPVVNEAIYGGSAIIQGDFTLDEAKQLAQRLNAGALPVPIDLLSQQTVGPTLGALSLEQSVNAAFLGFALVVLFMLLVYRFSGFVAVVALILYAFLNLAAYKLFGVTLTLAGIAGFVLSMGIAVDANVLIIERFKEEYKSGHNLPRSLEEAYKRAWPAIRDGNLTTLIAAAVLYWFSTSFIRGFAITLSIGVLLSMFTAIVVTRVYLRNTLDWKALRRPELYGLPKRTEK